MTVTTLEALAAEWERRGAEQQRSGSDEDWTRAAAQLRAYLDARPASDLEQRLRESARYFRYAGDPPTIALLLEAADANARNTDQQKAYCMRIAELERELAEARTTINRQSSQGIGLEVRMAAAKARLAVVATRADRWRGTSQSILNSAATSSLCTDIAIAEAATLDRCAKELEQALATPAQPNEGAP